MRRLVPLAQVADDRRLVAAGIDQAMDLAIAIAIARHDHRLAADPRGEKVVRLGDLGFQAEEDPAALEDMPHLELEQLGARINLAIDQEGVARWFCKNVQRRLLIRCPSAVRSW